MEYVITLVRGKDREVISRHENLESAKEAGIRFWNSYDDKGDVSCIKAIIDEDGKIHGQYWLYEIWD